MTENPETPEVQQKIRLLIVDDHPLVRRGLTDLFSRAEDVEIVGTAADGVQAVTMSIQESPNIVLMDLSMPTMNGIEATSRLLEACPEVRVVMLTSFSGKERVEDALRAGAVGYILKDSSSDQVLKVVREAARSSTRFSDL